LAPCHSGWRPGRGTELGQAALGTAMFFGMLGVTAFGLLFTPTFNVV
jgi:multidrug efflux pump subunit AcrB